MKDTLAPLPSSVAAHDATSGTVSRALQVLAVLADAGTPVSVKHIADHLHLAPSTAHRLLNLLKKDGFVDAATEGRQYVIGPQFYRVAARVVATVSPRDIAQPVIEAIANQFDETVLFGIYQGAQRALSFAGRADGRQVLKYEVALNTPLSLVWGASGKAILAYLSPDVISAVIDAEGPSPATGLPRPSPAAIQEALALVRAQGFAVSDGEKLPDARGIAAPVFGPKGVLGCLCMTSPKARMPHGEIAAIGSHIAACAAALSRDLGA